MNEQNDKIIDIIIQTSIMSSQVLKQALQNWLNKKSTKKGKIKFGQLAEQSNGKLESIEITNNNIRDFKDVAMKYNIDYSLKRDRSSDPPLYHVFFATKDTENFKKAFTEYAVGKQHGKDKTVTVPREDIKNLAVKVSEQAKNSKQKVRTRQKQKQVTR